MKKFNQFLIDYPDFWDGHTSYPLSVQNLINEWFYYREISSTSDLVFKRYLDRKLNILSFQFRELYDKQMSMTFDPLVLEKIEKVIDTVSNEGANEIIKRIIESNTNSESTNSNADNIVTTINNTSTTNNDSEQKNTGTETTVNTNTNTKNLTTTSDSEQKNTGTVDNIGSNSKNDNQKLSDYPQSTPSGFTNYISNESQLTSSASDNSTTTNNLTTTNDNEVVETGTVTDSGNNALTLNTINTLDSNSTTEDSGSNETERLTTLASNSVVDDSSQEDVNRTNDIDKTVNIIMSEVRSGMGSELFDKYFKLIKRVNAIDWLITELDVCFVQVFELEDEYDCSDASTENLQKQIDILFAQTRNLDTRVTYLEENGGGGGTGDVTKLYVDTRFQNINSYRTYNFDARESCDVMDWPIVQMGTLFIKGDNVTNLEVFIRCSPIIYRTFGTEPCPIVIKNMSEMDRDLLLMKNDYNPSGGTTYLPDDYVVYKDVDNQLIKYSRTDTRLISTYYDEIENETKLLMDGRFYWLEDDPSFDYSYYVDKYDGPIYKLI